MLLNRVDVFPCGRSPQIAFLALLLICSASSAGSRSFARRFGGKIPLLMSPMTECFTNSRRHASVRLLCSLCSPVPLSLRDAHSKECTSRNSGKQFHNRKQGTERRALYLFFNSLRLFFISLDKVRSSILAEKPNNAKIRDFTII